MRPGIRIGRPLDFSRYAGMEGDRFILRSITDEVMYEIMKLSGQEYVDIYATAAKRQLAEAAKATAAAKAAAAPPAAPAAVSAPAARDAAGAAPASARGSGAAGGDAQEKAGD
jgi:1-acyl-sn-glycerol-3-phosphate acyltransferase